MFDFETPNYHLRRGFESYGILLCIVCLYLCVLCLCLYKQYKILAKDLHIGMQYTHACIIGIYLGAYMLFYTCVHKGINMLLLCILSLDMLF